MTVGIMRDVEDPSCFHCMSHNVQHGTGSIPECDTTFLPSGSSEVVWTEELSDICMISFMRSFIVWSSSASSSERGRADK